jgi:hypothetical protein
MPAAFQYLTDLQSPAGKQIDDSFRDEMIARQKRFSQHWDYYGGVMPEPLKKEQDGYNDNVILAKVDQIADKIVSFLLGDGVRWDVGAEDDADTEDSVVEQLWQANRGKLLLHNIALAGALTGHSAVRLEPREGDFPRIVHINAKHFTAFWDQSDVERVLWYRLQYTLGTATTPTSGKRIDYVRGIFDGQAADHERDGWTEVVWQWDGHKWNITGRQPWPWPWPPIVDWQNMPRPHEYYGADDVRRAVALNDALNFVASNYNRILKHHGAPKTIGLGFDAAAIVGSEVGGFYTVNKPKTEADIFNLEMASDLASAREFLSIIAREMWQSARMVDPQTVKDTIGALTNFGLRVLYTDAISKTDTKRQLYGEAFETITQRALELAGQSAPGEITVQWPDVLPEDTEQISKSLLAELGAGVIDKQTYREIRGYDHEQIVARLEDEQAGEQNLGQKLLSAFAKGA